MSQKFTSKDLQEISELLDTESLAYKKCKSYACLVSDPTLQDKLCCYAKNHKARFDKLLNYLENETC